jgi:hypothetical protein
LNADRRDTLKAQHISTEFGEDHSREGRWADSGDLNDAKSCERPAHGLPAACGVGTVHSYLIVPTTPGAASP